MDGYAIIYNDKDNELNIIDTIYAGDNNNKLLENNSCIKIMTGKCKKFQVIQQRLFQKKILLNLVIIKLKL